MKPIGLVTLDKLPFHLTTLITTKPVSIAIAWGTSGLTVNLIPVPVVSITPPITSKTDALFVTALTLLALLYPYSPRPTCYRCLGPPTFFLFPTLSTIPLSMGHDNQQWRDLLRDLGPICRWWCSKHHLLKAKSTASLSSYFLFISDLFMLLSAWLHHASPSCHHAYPLASAWMTHHLLLVIMLTLLYHFCLLL